MGGLAERGHFLNGHHLGKKAYSKDSKGFCKFSYFRNCFKVSDLKCVLKFNYET